MTVRSVSHAHPSNPESLLGLLEPEPPRSLKIHPLTPLERLEALKQEPEYRWWSSLPSEARRLVKLATDMVLPAELRHYANKTPRQGLRWMETLLEVAGEFMDLYQDRDQHSRGCKCSACRPYRCVVCHKRLREEEGERCTSWKGCRRRAWRRREKQRLRSMRRRLQTSRHQGDDGLAGAPAEEPQATCRECGDVFVTTPRQRILDCCGTVRCASRRRRRLVQEEGRDTRSADYTARFRAERLPLYAERAAKGVDLFTGEPVAPPIPVEALVPGGAL